MTKMRCGIGLGSLGDDHRADSLQAEFVGQVPVIQAMIANYDEADIFGFYMSSLLTAMGEVGLPPEIMTQRLTESAAHYAASFAQIQAMRQGYSRA